MRGFLTVDAADYFSAPVPNEALSILPHSTMSQGGCRQTSMSCTISTVENRWSILVIHCSKPAGYPGPSLVSQSAALNNMSLKDCAAHDKTMQGNKMRGNRQKCLTSRVDKMMETVCVDSGGVSMQ